MEQIRGLESDVLVGGFSTAARLAIVSSVFKIAPITLESLNIDTGSVEAYTAISTLAIALRGPAPHSFPRALAGMMYAREVISAGVIRSQLI